MASAGILKASPYVKMPVVERDNKRCHCLRSKDMVPFQNVDRKGFKEMVKTLDPRYALHARTHFSQIEMPKLYGKVRKQVEKLIHAIKHLCFSEMEVTWEKI